MAETSRILRKIRLGEPCRVLFVNDAGFQHGAGIAMARQVQSFLLEGHSVMALCQMVWKDPEALVQMEQSHRGQWLGLTQLPDVKPGLEWWTPRAMVSAVVRECARAYADIIIVGNLHSAGWPLELLTELRKTGALVIAYMHDCYLFTGRCPYPGDCEQHLTGCTPSCPTADRYPPLKPELIPGAWQLRRDIFSGEAGIALATNSDWVLHQFERSMPQVRFAKTVHLALDETIFKPADQLDAREALGIPKDKFVVLAGAVDMSDARKGADLLTGLVDRLKDQVHFVVCGHGSEALPDVQPFPYSQDPARSARLCQAADVVLGTAREEAFGQTLLEGAACGRPCIALRAGGIPEIIEHERTGYMAARGVRDSELEELASAILSYAHSPEKCREHGAAARAKAEAHYTLREQGRRWREYIETALQHA